MPGSPDMACDFLARALLVSLIASGLVPAASRLPAQALRTHPDPRYIDAPVPPAFTIALDARPVASPFRLTATVRAAFGSEADSDGGLIGHIRAAALAASGDVIVLDDNQRQLRVFDPGGAPRERVGRAGRGPGEFSEPLSLAVYADGRVFVGDLLLSVLVFAPTAAGIRYERTLRIGVAPRAMCFLRGQLVVQGVSYGQPAILHVFDRSGQRIRSFGALYRSPNRALNYQFGTGMIACDPVAGVVVYAPRAGIGEFRAYRANGSLAWRTTVTGYLNNRVEETPGGGYRISGTGKGAHSIHSLTLMPGLGVLVQIAYRTEQAFRDHTAFTTLHSFLLDPVSGRPLPLGTTLQPILASGTGEVVLGFDDPSPRFEVRSLRLP